MRPCPGPLLATLVVLLLLVACGSSPERAPTGEDALERPGAPVEEQDAEAPDDVAADASSAEDVDQDIPEDEADPEPVAEPSGDQQQSVDFRRREGAAVRLVDARLHAHEGFDRFVLEFAGPAPSWQVRHFDGPVVEQPGGAVLELEGDGYVEVQLSPATSVDTDGAEPTAGYDGPTYLEGQQGPVREAAMSRDHDRTMIWTLGVAGRPNIAVAVAQGPERLVVDVLATG